MVGGAGVQSPVCLTGSERPLGVHRPEGRPRVTEEHVTMSHENQENKCESCYLIAGNDPGRAIVAFASSMISADVLD